MGFSFSRGRQSGIAQVGGRVRDYVRNARLLYGWIGGTMGGDGDSGRVLGFLLNI